MQNDKTYGHALPDQVDRIAALFDAHLALTADVRDIYRERAVLEREYATKLQLLARKALDKKTKLSQSVVVGDSPTKSFDESVLLRSTLDSAYGEIINSMSTTANDHTKLADALTVRVADTLKSIERVNEENKKKQMSFFQKLVAERDKLYSERAKCKQKYDEKCTEVENSRQKQGNIPDDRHAKQMDQQHVEMLNSKNAYLISIAIANQAKAKFYDEDLPGLEDSYQDLQTRLVTRFVGVLLDAQAIQIKHQDIVRERLTSVEMVIKGVSPTTDQDVFIDYNIRTFNAPSDWTFEPCSSHYDTDEMSLDLAPKVVLQNRLAKCRARLQEFKPVTDEKRANVQKFTELVALYAADPSLGDIDSATTSCIDARQQLAFHSTSERILATEMDIITRALGDDIGGQNPHAFKSSSFSIPTACGYCKTSIWGLSKQGKTCKLCQLSVHSKCELKVPANCPGGPGHRKPSDYSARASSTTSRAETTSIANGEVSAVSSSAPPDSPALAGHTSPMARVIFDFSASSSLELSVAEGAVVHIIDEDDGSGWVTVSDNQGKKGLVPASYVERTPIMEPDEPPRQTVHQGSGQFVRALYDYDAQGPDEIALTEGDSIELSSGPNGGKNYADGWWEGFSGSGKKGIFPSNYVA